LIPDLEMSQWLLVAFGAVVFLLGAFVKGTLGVGMPMVVAPLLSLVIPAPTTIALLGMPVLVSNSMQSIEGGLLRYSLKRFGWLILAQTVATILTVKMTLNLSPGMLNSLLAISVLAATVLMAFTLNLRIAPQHEKWSGILVGAASGLMSGVSSLTGPLIIAYLMALKLNRDMFVGSISIIYLFAAIPLYLSLWWFDRFGWNEFVLSSLALIPMVMGLKLGRLLRHRLSETLFRRILLGFLTIISLILLFK